MNANKLGDLFEETTKLKPVQIKVLTRIILEYDDPQELAYQAVGLLNNGVSYSKLKSDYQQEKFGWDSVLYVKERDARGYKDKILETPPEVREGEMKCPACNQAKTLVVEMQTRSADEGCTY